MIIEIRYRRCPKCGSPNVVKHSHDYKGAQKFHCRECKAYGTLDKQRKPDANTGQQALDAYFERVSMPGVARIFAISGFTLAH